MARMRLFNLSSITATRYVLTANPDKKIKPHWALRACPEEDVNHATSRPA